MADTKRRVRTNAERQLDLAVAACLYCQTLEAAAEALGVSVRTLRRWYDRPDFQEKLRARSSALADDLVSKTLERIKELGPKAADVAEDILDDDKYDPSARASIVRFVLDKVATLEERKWWSDVLARIEAAGQRLGDGEALPK